MAEANGAPPLAWFFATAERRRQAWRYWIADTAVGLLNMGLHYGLRLLPIDACSALGGVLGALAKYRYPASDARARKAWMTLRPNEADQASTDAAMRRLWRCVGRSTAEFSVLDRLWPAGRIAVDGLDYLTTARATGKPMIGMCLHLGNWETIPAMVLANGFKGASIYLPPDNRFEHFVVNRARDRLGGDYILASRRTGFEAIRTLVRKNQGILMYVDESVRGRVWAPAFGRPLRPQGNIAYILRIARLTGAIIFPIYSVRVVGGARFKVTVLPALELVQTGDRDADLMANIAMIDTLIDPIIRAHLDQWYYVLDFEFE
jgi:Kdo2-lipid IVA lauroyltransferase/acyltransferase